MPPIAGVVSSIAAFIGRALKGPANTPTHVGSFAEFTRIFGGLRRDEARRYSMPYAVSHFFQNGGSDALIVRVAAARGEDADGHDMTDAEILGDRDSRTGIFALESADLFNLLCIPPYGVEWDVAEGTWGVAARYCQERRAVLLVDAPAAWTAGAPDPVLAAAEGVASLRASVGDDFARSAAVYFPRLLMPDPLNEGRPDEFAPCGAVAGVIARTDNERGVWKAPAGPKASLAGVIGLTYTLADAEIERLTSLGLNCLRSIGEGGNVIWGARMLAGAGDSPSESKYLPVRRFALYLEESIDRGTRWADFEPNAEPLWARLRLDVNAFLDGLFRQGAFQATRPGDAYFVKCGRETTTEQDIDAGVVNLLVGFAPLRSAEFMVVRIRRTAGRART